MLGGWGGYRGEQLASRQRCIMGRYVDELWGDIVSFGHLENNHNEICHCFFWNKMYKQSRPPHPNPSMTRHIFISFSGFYNSTSKIENIQNTLLRHFALSIFTEMYREILQPPHPTRPPTPTLTGREVQNLFFSSFFWCFSFCAH